MFFRSQERTEAERAELAEALRGALVDSWYELASKPLPLADIPIFISSVSLSLPDGRDSDCSICHKPGLGAESVVETKTCRHVFHEECLTKRLHLSTAICSICPICSTVLGKRTREEEQKQIEASIRQQEAIQQAYQQSQERQKDNKIAMIVETVCTLAVVVGLSGMAYYMASVYWL
jgi:hypothetical protein